MAHSCRSTDHTTMGPASRFAPAKSLSQPGKRSQPRQISLASTVLSSPSNHRMSSRRPVSVVFSIPALLRRDQGFIFQQPYIPSL